MIVGLPMYDLPGLEGPNDRLWEAICTHLRAAGIHAPSRLTRSMPTTTLWTNPDLLLAQTCGYPLMTSLAGRVRVVATPRYRARGCDGPNHCSLIIVRKSDLRGDLDQFRGSRCALNDEASNTGMNLLRAEIAPLVKGAGDRFFDEVVVTGSHTASIDAIIDSDADIAAIDCVNHALLDRLRPTHLERVRILQLTAQTPGLPLITAETTPPKVIRCLQAALAAVERDPDVRPFLDALLIDGFSQVPFDGYRSIMRAEQTALLQGYLRLR